MERASFQTGWAAIDQTSDPGYYIHSMDTVRKGKDSDPEQYRSIFELLAVREGETILDVGCGTGSTVREARWAAAGASSPLVWPLVETGGRSWLTHVIKNWPTSWSRIR